MSIVRCWIDDEAVHPTYSCQYEKVELKK